METESKNKVLFVVALYGVFIIACLQLACNSKHLK